MGSALFTILIAILNAVFGSILEFAHVQDVITGISALFSMEDFAETAFSLRQTDIAGFYNQVEHDRILLAIQFAIFTFASQCEQGLDTVMQSHVVRLERILRVFQGSWREKTKQYMTITLRDIPSLVQYLLDHSYFTVGSQVFRQCRGASMGSQFASRAILSGLCARLRLIRSHVFPAKIQLDQVQDFLGLMYQRIPEFFTDANICLTHRFLRSLWKDQPVQSLMQWCR